MATRKRQEAPQSLDADPDSQQSQGSRKKRRHRRNEALHFFASPYYGGELAQSGLATINGGQFAQSGLATINGGQFARPGPATVGGGSGGDYQDGFFKGEQRLESPFSVPHRPNWPVLVAGHSLADLGIDIPPSLGNDELVRRQGAVLEELSYQRNNPPCLPRSKVPDLPPKEEIPDYVEIPPGVDADTRKLLEENNRISALAQKVERHRNNLAAKKSRGLRVEARDNYRELYVQATAKLFYHRLAGAASGRDPNIWERLPKDIRDDLVGVVRRAERAVETARMTEKKQEDARLRSERNSEKKDRKMLQGAAGLHAGTGPFEQMGPFAACEDLGEELEVVTPRGHDA